MDPVANPYAPGAGRRPPELAGRDRELERFDVVVRRLEQGRSDQSLVLTGLRGVGKTVLLNEFRDLAERQGWLTAKIEAGGSRPFRALASQALNRALRSAAGRGRIRARLARALGVFHAFSLRAAPDGSLSVGIDLEPVRGRADTGDLEIDLAELLVDLGEAAADLGHGVVLLIDEMQDLDRTDLAAIVGSCHETSQRTLPVVVVGVGLPNLPSALAEAKSYAERLFDYRSIGPLTRAHATAALVRPSEALGVRWARAAVDEVLRSARGYPFFLQVYGKATWDYGPGPNIAGEDAAVGVRVARGELDLGFYGSRWERATSAQRVYLHALAEAGPDDGAAPTARIATMLSRRPSDLSQARDQLIRKGLVYAPDRGTVAFTVPGMAGFVRRQD